MHDPSHHAHGPAAPLDGEGWTRGAKVGNYRLEARLGQGGAGEVWRATHLPTGAERALKTLLPFADDEDRARFTREAKALAQLDGHPHVMRIHEVGVAARRPFLVMDLALPEDLAARLQAGPLAEPAARELVLALAGGLEHVHAHGLLHRDLKPHNVLFADDGRPLLSDFGLVRGPDRSSLSRTGAVYGTPAYMAPEQALGLPIDARTDVYGLGAVLYHALSGRPPFGGASPLAVMQAVVEDDPQPPSRLVPSLSPELERVCLRALAKDPAARFASVHDFAAALRGEGLPQRPTHGKALALGAIAVALACGALAWARLSLREAAAVAAQRTATPDPPPPPGLESRPEAPLAPPGPLEEFFGSLDSAQAELDALLERDPLVSAAFEGTRLAKRGVNAALALNQLDASPRALAALYLRSTEGTPDAWRYFAEFVQAQAPVTLGLPDDAARDALAVALLERGISRGSLGSMALLGALTRDGAWGLEQDADRAFALLDASVPAPGDSAYEERVTSTALLGVAPPRSFSAPPPDGLLLARINAALDTGRLKDELKLQRRLCEARHVLQRKLGSAGLQALSSLEAEPGDWEAIEAEPQVMLVPERAEALCLIGQSLLVRQGKDPAEHLAYTRRALLSLFEAAGSDPRAWADLASLIENDRAEPFALPPPHTRLRMAREARWRGVEAGDLRAIASLGWRYAHELGRLPAELERLRAVLAHVDARHFTKGSLDLTLLGETDRRAMLAFAVAHLALAAPGNGQFSRAQALDLVSRALNDRNRDPMVRTPDDWRNRLEEVRRRLEQPPAGGPPR
ncbi:MAG: serine/threonine protein kinase [Planctomycetes bacterium]|nr:serine/threonine protein kinase [Planctomycetota bacterium]